MVSALEEAKVLVVDFKLEVLCYSAKGLPLKHAVSKLLIPGLIDQFNLVGNTVLPNLLAQHPQVRQTISCIISYGSLVLTIHLNTNSNQKIQKHKINSSTSE